GLFHTLYTSAGKYPDLAGAAAPRSRPSYQGLTERGARPCPGLPGRDGRPRSFLVERFKRLRRFEMKRITMFLTAAALVLAVSAPAVLASGGGGTRIALRSAQAFPAPKAAGSVKGKAGARTPGR